MLSSRFRNRGPLAVLAGLERERSERRFMGLD